ncbi:hypothetical protein Barb7_02803 [Bacteroidales bacterium Barb7]|nr:hypothetical protein Barb7_02803 [Bacteroidales bacterium Barb7]
MPQWIVHDNSFAVFHILPFIDGGIGFVGYLFVQFAAFIVIPVHVFALLAGGFAVLCQKQVNGFLPVFHPAGGVDARAYLKDNVADGYIRAGQPADVNNPFQPQPGIAVKLFQSVVRQNPVLASNRHNIGSNADRRQIQQILQIGKGTAVAQGKSLHKLKPYPATRQMRIRIHRIRPFGIQYGNGIRQRIVRRMMIANDKINAVLLGIFHLVVSLYPAVQRNNERDAVFDGILNTLMGHTIFIIIPPWNIII